MGTLLQAALALRLAWPGRAATSRVTSPAPLLVPVPVLVGIGHMRRSHRHAPRLLCRLASFDGNLTSFNRITVVVIMYPPLLFGIATPRAGSRAGMDTPPGGGLPRTGASSSRGGSRSLLESNARPLDELTTEELQPVTGAVAPEAALRKAIADLVKASLANPKVEPRRVARHFDNAF